MRSLTRIALALLVATHAGAQEAATFPTWTPRAGDSYEVEIEGSVRFNHTQSGGEVEPLDQSDGETRERRLRVRHVEGGAVEIEYLADARSSLATTLVGRTLRARPGDPISIEVVGGAPLAAAESSLAREDARGFLAGDPRALLFAGRPADRGAVWTIDDARAADLFCDFEEPREVRIKVAHVDDREGVAVLEVQVRVRSTRTEGPLVAESTATGSGELEVDAATGRIRSWTWDGAQTEQDRVADDAGREMVLRYDRTEEVRVAYSSD